MYDVIIIGAGPGGIFSAYELMKQDENLKIAVFDAGHSLEQRHCPIDGEKVKSCIGWKTWATAGAIRYKTAYPASDRTARAGVPSSTTATAAAAASRRRGRRCRSGWERVLRIRSGDGPTGSFIRR